MTLTQILLIFIVVAQLLSFCCDCVVLGVLIERKHKTKPRPAPEISEERLREIERIKREYSNMLSYDGSEQEDFNG